MLNDWQRIAREFGDHDMDVVSGCERCCEMIQQTLASYVGEWLPSEPTAKEILRLRKRVEVLERVREAAEKADGDWFDLPSVRNLRKVLDAAEEAADA